MHHWQTSSACLPINSKAIFTCQRFDNSFFFVGCDYIKLLIVPSAVAETKTFILIREQRKTGVEFPLCDLRGLRHIIYICHTVGNYRDYQ